LIHYIHHSVLYLYKCFAEGHINEYILAERYTGVLFTLEMIQISIVNGVVSDITYVAL